MGLLGSMDQIWPLFKIHMLITQIVKRITQIVKTIMQIVKIITLWNVLGIGHSTCCEILACPNYSESPYPSQWIENH
jgi:hypothetical protein